MILRVLPILLLAAPAACPAAAAPISAADIKAARTVIEAVKKPDYDAAWAAVERIRSDRARKAMRWYLLIDPDSGASFADITGFALDNPGWPRIGRLRRNASRALRDDTPVGRCRRLVQALRARQRRGLAGLREGPPCDGRR